jgi:exodeoxyribonuclease VII large subunit
LDALLPARIGELRSRVQALGGVLERNSPLARLRHDRERLLGLETSLRRSVQHAVALRWERVQGLERQLTLMNPYATLDRGYSITYDAAGHVVSSVAAVQPGDTLAVRVSDGMIGVQAAAVGEGIAGRC